jgi:hypothetical protein
MNVDDFSEDDDLEGEGWKALKKPKQKNFKTNPAGPYNVKFQFKNIEWDITIKNITENDYKVIARSNIKVDQDEIEILKYYLQEEGFEEEAKKHNLFWN